MIHFPRPIPKPAPGFWPTLGALAAIYISILGPFSCSAKGQQIEEAPLPAPLLELILQETPPEPAQAESAALAPRAAGIPGVGYPGGPPVPETFVSNWCAQTNVSGCNPRFEAAATAAGFSCALCPRGWQGFFAEWFPNTDAMLRGCWEMDFWGTRNTHSGTFTVTERERAFVFQPQRSREYEECWYKRSAAGGSPELAFVIDSDSAVKSYRRLIDQAKIRKAWKPGVFSFRWDATTAWPTWVENALPANHPENQAVTPPPVPPTPPPVPVPVPAPPPPTPPPCTSWPISGWLEQCGKLATKAGKELAGAEELCVWCEAKRPAPETVLARLRGLVCEPVTCEVAPPPPVVEEPPPPEPEKLCPRVRVVVTPEEFVMPEFIPGIESTARLELELVPQEWVECPEVMP